MKSGETARQYRLDLENSKIIAIIAHIRPDGDALGAMLGLAAALKKSGKTVFCFCDSEIPAYLTFLAGVSEINKGDISKARTFIAVDCADEPRMGKYADAFHAARETICIDHHITNLKYARTNIVETASSTCELVLKVIESLKVPLDKTIAECLYTGISTDTGNFSQSNVTANTHTAAAKLCAFNIDVEELSRRLFKEIPYEKLMLIKDCLGSMRILEDGKIALILIRQKDLTKHGLSINDTENIINYAFNVKGVRTGVCMTEHASNSYKVSLRTKRGISAAKIASSFGGGGHEQAAGFIVNGYTEDCVEKIVRAVNSEL